MKKTDKITIVAVVLSLVIAYFLLPTTIGVNVKVEGKAPITQTVCPTTEPSTAPQATAPTTQPSQETTKPAENTGNNETQKTDSDKPESVKEIIDQYTLLVDKFKKEKPAYTKKEYQALPEEYRNFGGPINTVLNIASGYMVSEEDAEALVAEIEDRYPDVDIDAHSGGQPIYYYVIAVE